MCKIQNKFIYGIVCLLTIMGLIVPVQAAGLSLTENGITYMYENKRLKVECNGKMILSDKTPGILENGNGLVPYNIFQYKDLGVKAQYNKKTKAITFQYKNQKAIVTVGKDNMVCNGKEILLPAKPRFVRYNQSKITKLLVPSRKIAETLGLDYEYNSEKALISIKQKGSTTQNDIQSSSVNRQVEIDGKKIILLDSDVQVKVENTVLKTPTKGIILNDIAMLPVYHVFSKNSIIRTTYKYDSKKKQGIITGNGNTLVFTIGNKEVVLNGKKQSLLNNIYMVKEKNVKKEYCVIPGREISRLLGFDYTWDVDNSMSIITKKVEKPSEETIGKPSGGAIEKPSVGGAEKPSGGTVEKPSTEPVNCELIIKRPSSKVEWSMCDIVDDYHNRRWIITLQGDYKKFYEENPVFYNQLEIQSVQIQKNKEGNTEIIIQTPTIKGVLCHETKTNWEIEVKAPKEIYKKILVLDAGHGGKDSGAVSSSFGVIEKESALKMVQAAKKYFDKDQSMKVYYTRLTDEQSNITYGNTVSSTTTSVINRAKFANEIEADLFISIHCNSAISETARGTEVLYSSLNTTVKENGLTSKLFAETAFPILLDAVGSTKRSVKDYPNLIVCKNSEMPAILMEIAFVSNREDAKILKDDACIDRIGKGIYDIVVETYQQYPVNR